MHANLCLLGEKLKMRTLLVVFACLAWMLPGKADLTFIDLQKNTIHLEWLSHSSLEGEENVFMSASLEAYQKYPPAALGVADKFTFLKAVFADVRKDFQEKNGYILSAKLAGKVIGFIQCKETNIPHQMYICQLAVAPEYWKHGIASELIHQLHHRFPNINHLVAISRKINEPIQRFYTKMGFVKCGYMHPGYDPERYVGYEWKSSQ